MSKIPDLQSLLDDYDNRDNTKDVTPEFLLSCIPALRNAGYLISDMECAKVLPDGFFQPDFQFAMLGLLKNGDDDWPTHENPDRITRAAIGQLTGAIEAPDDYLF